MSVSGFDPGTSGSVVERLTSEPPRLLRFQSNLESYDPFFSPSTIRGKSSSLILVGLLFSVEIETCVILNSVAMVIASMPLFPTVMAVCSFEIVFMIL